MELLVSKIQLTKMSLKIIFSKEGLDEINLKLQAILRTKDNFGNRLAIVYNNSGSESNRTLLMVTPTEGDRLQDQSVLKIADFKIQAYHRPDARHSHDLFLTLQQGLPAACCRMNIEARLNAILQCFGLDSSCYQIDIPLASRQLGIHKGIAFVHFSMASISTEQIVMTKIMLEQASMISHIANQDVVKKPRVQWSRCKTVEEPPASEEKKDSYVGWKMLLQVSRSKSGEVDVFQLQKMFCRVTDELKESKKEEAVDGKEESKKEEVDGKEEEVDGKEENKEGEKEEGEGKKEAVDGDLLVGWGCFLPRESGEVAGSCKPEENSESCNACCPRVASQRRCVLDSE